MKIKEIKTEILGFPLILWIDENHKIVSCMTEEGGSYPLLDFERDILRQNLICL